MRRPLKKRSFTYPMSPSSSERSESAFSGDPSRSSRRSGTMYQVEVQDQFSAAHFLKLYDGSFEPRHGHNWKVVVAMQSDKLDSMGVVVDFEALKPALKKVLSELHEISINDHPHFKDEKVN